MKEDVLDFPEKSDSCYADCVMWWESRRLKFNLIVLISGLFSVFVLIFNESEDLNLAVVFFIFFFGLMANICYCLGFIFESLVYYYSEGKSRLSIYRESLFWIGVIFSAFIVLLPGALSLMF